MGGPREFVGNALADGLLPLFRRPMEDVVYETLDRRDVPTRSEMRDYVDTSVDPGLQARVRELEARLGELEARLLALDTDRRPTRGRHETSGTAVDDAPEERHCKVQGCKEPHRSKGYCARHYQQWRRGALESHASE